MSKNISSDSAKPGRNDPCPCGSGKKYRKCCGAEWENSKSQIRENLFKQVYALFERGLFEEAGLLGNQLLQDKQTSFDVVHLMGLIKFRQCEYAEAEKLLSKAELLVPTNQDVKSNLGALFLAQGKWKQSLNTFLKAESLNSTDPIVLTSIGFAAHNLGKTDEALEYCRRAVEIAPEFVGAYVNLGLVLEDGDYDEELLEIYERLVRLNPSNPAPYPWLLRKYGDLNREGDIEKLVANILAHPSTLASPGIVNELGKEGCWTSQETILNLLIERIRSGGLDVGALESALLSLNYSPYLSPEEIFNIHHQWGRAVKEEVKGQHSLFQHSASNNRKLRIAYISADLRNHPVSYFIRNIIAHHDTDKFEIICYYNSPVVDEVTNEIMAEVSIFIHVNELNDIELANKIYSDKVDILVDLSGHTSGSRVAVMARKPAPLQITYLGYPNTSGLESVDYRISDPYCDVEGGTKYTEKLLILPESFLCFGALDEVNIVEELPVERNKRITLGSFNNVQKINPEVISVWANIMSKLESAQLLIKADYVNLTVTQNNIRSEFAKFGIDADRLLFKGRTISYRDHLTFYNDVDLALDTFPYNGTTTTCEALWMGVPVITLTGKVHAQRVSYSILRNTGLEELAAFEKKDYIKAAVALADDVDRLRKYRISLRTSLQNSILCDPKKFTCQLEEAYMRAWSNLPQ